ncbi:hypothetical protein [Rhizobium leguminosarum]|nr:hypothetical protein [Rhizobium leguminosarum]
MRKMDQAGWNRRTVSATRTTEVTRRPEIASGRRDIRRLVSLRLGYDTKPVSERDEVVCAAVVARKYRLLGRPYIVEYS